MNAASNVTIGEATAGQTEPSAAVEQQPPARWDALLRAAPGPRGTAATQHTGSTAQQTPLWSIPLLLLF
eukprot:m51a1_g1934 hypothetical protein (69) ;mRNA; r:917295-917501